MLLLTDNVQLKIILDYHRGPKRLSGFVSILSSGISHKASTVTGGQTVGGVSSTVNSRCEINGSLSLPDVEHPNFYTEKRAKKGRAEEQPIRQELKVASAWDNSREALDKHRVGG